eukprot:COSAG01_NODE_9414_length_2452_cov_1010.167446_3_plen_146_part_00
MASLRRIAGTPACLHAGSCAHDVLAAAVSHVPAYEEPIQPAAAAAAVHGLPPARATEKVRLCLTFLMRLTFLTLKRWQRSSGRRGGCCGCPRTALRNAAALMHRRQPPGGRMRKRRRLVVAACCCTAATTAAAAASTTMLLDWTM